jgi:hypothetical protein
MNEIQIIKPYRLLDTWVFDDESLEIKKEPFVAGIPDIIDELVKDIPNAEKGFKLFFSDKPFPGYQVKLDWERAEYGGNWYRCAKYNKSGWLCACMYNYMAEAPKNFYAKAEKL